MRKRKAFLHMQYDNGDTDVPSQNIPWPKRKAEPADRRGGRLTVEAISWAKPRMAVYGVKWRGWEVSTCRCVTV